MEKKLVTLIFVICPVLIFVISKSTSQFALPYDTPYSLLENPFAVFIIFFMLFFAILYLALARSLGGSPAVPAIVAAALAFVVAASIQGKWQVLKQPLVFWAVVFCFAALAVLFFVVIFKYAGVYGAIGLFSFIYGFGPFLLSKMPGNWQALVPDNIYYFWNSTYGWGILLFFCVLFYIAWRQHYIWKHRWKLGY